MSNKMKYKITNETMTLNIQDTNLSWYVANVDHTISGQGTATSTFNHSPTTPSMIAFKL